MPHNKAESWQNYMQDVKQFVQMFIMKQTVQYMALNVMCRLLKGRCTLGWVYLGADYI